jgi:hypothetical protein
MTYDKRRKLFPLEAAQRRNARAWAGAQSSFNLPAVKITCRQMVNRVTGKLDQPDLHTPPPLSEDRLG